MMYKKRQIETNGRYLKEFGLAETGLNRHHIIPYKSCMHYYFKTGDEKYLDLAVDKKGNSIDLPKKLHTRLHQELAKKGFKKHEFVPEDKWEELTTLTYELISELKKLSECDVLEYDPSESNKKYNTSINKKNIIDIINYYKNNINFKVDTIIIKKVINNIIEDCEACEWRLASLNKRKNIKSIVLALWIIHLREEPSFNSRTIFMHPKVKKAKVNKKFVEIVNNNLNNG